MPPSRQGIITFSSASNSGSRWCDWNTKPSERLRNAATSSCGSVYKSRPPKRTSPAVGRSSPPRMCRSVDLPAPETPSTASDSPGRSLRFTRASPSIVSSPSTKRFTTPVASSSLIAERLRGIQARRLPRRQERRADREHHRDHGDERELHRLDGVRQALQLVDVRRQDVEAERALYTALHHVEIPGDHQPHADAEREPDDPDQEALDREHAQDPVVRAAHGLHDRDVL